MKTIKKARSFAWMTIVVCALLFWALPSSSWALGLESDDLEKLESSGLTLEETNVEFESETLKDAGRISVKQKLVGDGIEYNLYPTFDDRDAAISYVANNAPKRLSLISSSSFLLPLLEQNWRAYYDKMRALYDDVNCPDWYMEADDEENLLQCAFSILENDALNEGIISSLNSAVASASDEADVALDASDAEDILLSLPDQEMLSESLEEDESAAETVSGETSDNGETKVSSSVQSVSEKAASKLSKLNKAKAIAYAKKYADEPNRGKYGYCEGRDCANFASQILEAGGIKQTSKWWHKNSNGKQTQSDDWVTANGFAKYFGVGYKTHSPSAFSSHLKAGDLIGTSFVSDGKWNHIGFVTAVGSKKNGSYDYQVAQHSKNYVAWTSSKINSWENQGGKDRWIGRIGR
ncbi:MAG: amidase domain-containing protein [Coriobacteriia bacterium]|nr:amidase domain-containing protein [Coriobacteriia bacterium]